MTALATALDERFFTQARALKRATAISALRRLLASARAAAEAAAPAGQNFAAAGRRARTAGTGGARRPRRRADRAARAPRRDVPPRRPRGARVRAPALAGCSGSTARPPPTKRSWVSCSRTRCRGPSPQTRAALVAAVADDASRRGRRARAITAAVDQAIDRFAAYARGVIDGGAVPDFFRHQLPRLRLEVGAIRDALMRRAPDPEQALFAPLRRELEALFDAFGRALADAEIDATTRAALHAARLASPLAALAEVIDALEQHGSPWTPALSPRTRTRRRQRRRRAARPRRSRCRSGTGWSAPRSA